MALKRHRGNISCIVNTLRQIGVRDFKYVGKICPLHIGHVIYDACAVAAYALSMVSYGRCQSS